MQNNSNPLIGGIKSNKYSCVCSKYEKKCIDCLDEWRTAKKNKNIKTSKTIIQFNAAAFFVLVSCYIFFLRYLFIIPFVCNTSKNCINPCWEMQAKKKKRNVFMR